jgi:hypothetical protein
MAMCSGNPEVEALFVNLYSLEHFTLEMLA